MSAALKNAISFAHTLFFRQTFWKMGYTLFFIFPSLSSFLFVCLFRGGDVMSFTGLWCMKKVSPLLWDRLWPDWSLTLFFFCVCVWEEQRGEKASQCSRSIFFFSFSRFAWTTPSPTTSRGTNNGQILAFFFTPFLLLFFSFSQVLKTLFRLLFFFRG